MVNRYIHGSITFVLLLLMAAVAVALWRGTIPIEWLTSFGYKGIFVLSLVNGIAPVAGPSQIATFFVASKLNPLIVGVAAGVGGAIGELAGYAFGYSLRASQTPEVERRIQRFANWRLLRITRERSFISLFVLASIPNPLFDPASALAGSLRIGFVRYFIPVLLGKIVRHLAIAYAGYYSITAGIPTLLDKPTMFTYIDSGLFVAAVVGIAVVAWLVRSFAESDPDPLLLNLTFFAFAGQCILTAELIGKEKPVGAIIGLDLLALILVIVQIIVLKAQVSTTLEHYKDLLDRNKSGIVSSEQIDRWADVLVRITGVDFYPEFYIRLFQGFGPRDQRRKQAVFVLTQSHNQFKIGNDAITVDALKVPPQNRQFLWRIYAIGCGISWALFIFCILFARRYQ